MLNILLFGSWWQCAGDPVSLIWPSFLSDAYLRLGRALRSLFPILVNFGCRAVRQGLGRRARGRWHFAAKVIQTLYKLVMIVRLAVQTKGLFTPSLGRAGRRTGGAHGTYAAGAAGQRACGTPPFPTTCFYCTIAPSPRRCCTQYSAD